MKKLIDDRAYLNGQDCNGETALIYAAANGYIAVVNTLKGAGTDINVRDHKGVTAWIYASENEKVLECMLEKHRLQQKGRQNCRDFKNSIKAS